jgi:toxin CcdB
MHVKTMQFDVYPNPIVTHRRAYPYVTVMQSDDAENASDQIVAPLVKKASLSKVSGQLTPTVTIESSEYVVLVPSMTGMRRRDLNKRVCSLVDARADLLAAVDHLFFGI